MGYPGGGGAAPGTGGVEGSAANETVETIANITKNSVLKVFTNIKLEDVMRTNV